MMRRHLFAPLVCIAILGASHAAAQHVTPERIVRAEEEPENWLTYSGGYSSQRHTSLRQITRANVRDLEQKWVLQGQVLGAWQSSPLVVDGIMYLTQRPNDVLALDARTGRVFWQYRYNNSADQRVCCGANNRGLAIHGDTLFMGTLDAHLIAIDARNGQPIWKTTVADSKLAYSVTMAPLVIKDLVIVGTGGGEYGIRGFIAAYDVRTGKEVWRFNAIPAPGEPGSETWQGDDWEHGGASVWITGSYDPELNLTYWGIGNPGPDWNGDSRAGDNLYSESVVALDADTGQLKWHFQFTPHDEFDYDSVQVPVLADLPWQGTMRKVMLWANRNGFWYVLDRATGQFLFGKPFVKVNWTSGLDEKGRPMNMLSPTPQGTLVYPGNQGGTNWYSPSYSPRTGLFYIPSWMDTSSTYIKRPIEFTEGRRFTGALPMMPVGMLQPSPIVNRRLPEDGYGAVQAFDPRTGEKKWEFKMTDVTDSGLLTTASDVLFSGGREGYFFALDARTGALLWKASVGGHVSAGPMTYAAGGRQYVAIAAGNSLFTYALRQ